MNIHKLYIYAKWHKRRGCIVTHPQNPEYSGFYIREGSEKDLIEQSRNDLASVHCTDFRQQVARNILGHFRRA